jgi:CelD/BcsL family acetyltransferase involved in cellulose biosynthesis
MYIEQVRGLDALHELEADWKRVYAADPEGQFFLSWPWMSKRLERRPGWFVLVARAAADASPIAFFPLRDRTRKSSREGKLVELSMPGRGAADYTGFICEPEHQRPVARAFAAYLLELDWHELRLECLRASDQRAGDFLGCFTAAHFDVKREPMVMSSGIDNAICPYAELPDDWDRYLAKLSSNTRQRLRRLLRMVDGSSVRITTTTAETAERDVEILLRLWRARWGQKKGDRLQTILDSTREELLDAMDNGTLYLTLLWRDDKPLGANSCMLDRTKREMLFQIGARDEGAEELSPGLLLHAHAIRTAIERGLMRYDFMRGNEPYKFSFATAERRIESVVLRRIKAA